MINATDAAVAKARAEELFKSQQLLDAGDSNRTTAETAKIAEGEKTVRLRALRLAKEQSDQIAADARRASGDTDASGNRPSSKARS